MQQMKFEAFLPDFSGFSSVGWASLVSDPQHRAAQQYAKENAAEGCLNAEDYIKIIEQMEVSAKQRTLLAQKYTQSFAIQLAYSMCSPHGLQFDRYDFDADRIVVTIPLRSICRLIMLFELDNLAPLLGGDWAGRAAGDLDPAVTECLRRLDPTFLCSMLAATVKVSSEKRELRKLAGEADRVFGQSVDWDKFRTMLRARRREKRQIAAAVSHGPVSH